MVALLYCLILAPLLFYVSVFGFETFLSVKRVFSGSFDQGTAFVHATWEITHTILIYAVVMFMVSHAELLPIIATTIFLPVVILMIALISRGTLYLYLFYGEVHVSSIGRLWHGLFSLTHLINLAAALWLTIAVSYEIITRHFIPSTDDIGLVASGLIPVALLCAVPLYHLYRTNVTK
ncbi:MAG: hypothetical protein ABI716_03525 [Candidatus Saccharibacteria bacterium]